MKRKIYLKLLLTLALILSIIPLVSEPADAASVSYMLNKKKVYTYQDYQLKETYEAKFDKNKSKEIERIVTQSSESSGLTCFTDHSCYKEDKKTLSQMVMYAGLIENLTYPVKVNKSWETSMGDIRKITAIKTVKVKAGTFKNVVVVKETRSYDKKEFYIEYYAPNVGLILKEASNEETNYKTTKQIELIKLK
ncbi:hypothetical protein SAMN05880501_10299 [Ureibacillus xyleni]|uniref:Uncharacterized protein n=1 Tax=Ureibacillus xyleni TaxID=614648 RepID=A0A285S1Q4_9BACL|nr:hypothetical protein [Ureibacillus xyleni]SOB98794.1 hypothetical protein SAMN05880501_10299 [Ureibacillus xyleni]